MQLLGTSRRFNVHENTRQLRKFGTASRTTEDKSATTLLAKYSQQVDALFDGFLIFLIDKEFGSLEAPRSCECQIIRVNTGRTSTRLKVDDHSSVGCEIAWASEALVGSFTMRQLVLYERQPWSYL